MTLDTDFSWINGNVQNNIYRLLHGDMGIGQSDEGEISGEMACHHTEWLPFVKSLLKYGEYLGQGGVVEEWLESIPLDKRRHFERNKLLGDKVTIDDFVVGINICGLQGFNRIFTPYRTGDKLSYLEANPEGDMRLDSDHAVIGGKRFEEVISYAPEDIEPALTVMRNLFDPEVIWGYVDGFS